MDRRTAIVLLATLALGGCPEKSASPANGGGGDGPSAPYGCGNSELNGLEQCDGALFVVSSDCVAYGLGTGTVACARDCLLDFSGCSISDFCQANSMYGDGACDDCEALGGTQDSDCATLCGSDGTCADSFDPKTGTWSCQAATGNTDPDCGECGNGVIDGNELCDDTAWAAGDSCNAFGYATGTLKCGAQCVPDFTGCLDYVCGDYLVEADEECDGANLLSVSCEGLGYSGGELACTAGCRLDTSGCQNLARPDLGPLAVAVCAYISRCEAELGRPFESQYACQGGFEFIFGCLFDLHGTQADVNACAAAYASFPCDPAGLDAPPDTACARLDSPEPAASLDESCAGRWCADGLHCSPSTSAGVCPVCEADPGVGEACGWINNDYVWCAAGATCDGDTSLCVALLADGESCASDDDCISDWCRDDVCAAPLAVGSPCIQGDECAGEFRECIAGFCSDPKLPGSACMDGEECVLLAPCLNGQCTRVSLPDCGDVDMSPGQIGAACNGPGTGCVAGAWCDGSIDPDTCVAVTPIGRLCADWDECGEQAYCAGTPDGVCTAYAGVGQSCDSVQCIDPAFCVYPAETCSPLLGLDEPCDVDWQCESDYCDPTSLLCADPAACVMP